MHFVAILADHDGALPVRMAHRPAHLEWLKTAPIPIAGPFLDEKGDMIGTMVIIEAEDEAAARAILAEDPFAKAGLFKSLDLRAWRWGWGKPA
ncbi:YciI family protein [Kaistia geumhonensis]|uniref:Uncharacterized protein YciI n=1 Tax=Kaistia geumhonensis TaxID=410839 RepID=A0ABU0M823_9HYPH|nr:YciI family protein [Kaistia geumhonensis]MCX5477670.1 YciI family protein [Kaistia geumhonensis]MDQ0517121.1 uncharacterized protein YciI [Kaistia geumhonensis]